MSSFMYLRFTPCREGISKSLELRGRHSWKNSETTLETSDETIHHKHEMFDHHRDSTTVSEQIFRPSSWDIFHYRRKLRAYAIRHSVVLKVRSAAILSIKRNEILNFPCRIFHRSGSDSVRIGSISQRKNTNSPRWKIFSQPLNPGILE